jgi:hypothetical protein
MKKTKTKRKRRKKPQKDENQMAFDAVENLRRIEARLASRPPKDPAAQALGRKGGIARKRKLSLVELTEIGKQGANARWRKQKDKTVVPAAEKQ